jgi:ABC-type spermidine/putrescine transport system permease subunit I
MRPVRYAGLVAPFLPVALLYGVALALPLATIVSNALSLTGAEWLELLQEPIFMHAVRNTVVDCVVISTMGTLLAYALAAAIWRAGPTWRVILIGLVIIPFWTSVLVKVVAWEAILRDNGLLNTVLLRLGLIATPLVMLHASTAVIVGMIQYVLPFAVFPILGVLLRLDPQLELAADSLGAGPLRSFSLVILPLSAPGILAAFMLIFVICTGFYVIPATLGSPADGMIANVVAVYALQLVDFNQASAIGLVLVVAVLLLTVLYNRISHATAGTAH